MLHKCFGRRANLAEFADHMTGQIHHMGKNIPDRAGTGHVGLQTLDEGETWIDDPILGVMGVEVEEAAP